MKTYNPNDFLKEVRSGNELQGNISVLGFVKSYNNNEDSILLSSDLFTCTRWLPIPTAIIDSVTYLGKRLCVRHETNS